MATTIFSQVARLIVVQSDVREIYAVLFQGEYPSFQRTSSNLRRQYHFQYASPMLGL